MWRISIALLACLSGCASWPSGSYVSGTDNSTRVAADISDYVVRALPAGSYVRVIPATSEDTVAAALIADLNRAGVRQDAGGYTVRYVVTPMDDGLLVRVTLNDTQGASRWYRVDGERLTPGGPLMIAMP